MNLTNEEIEKRISDSYELPNRVVEKHPRPLVSIRTSTYNHGPYIKQCIEGVLMQKTNFSFEYIIGEDYSTDETRKIVFEYAKKYPDVIRVITADYNVGSKANGRRCIRACRGKYMAICEGDDYWTDPLKLQKQVDFLENHPEFGMCYTNYKTVYANSDKIIPAPIASRPSGDVFERLLLRNFIVTASILVRTDVYSKASENIRNYSQNWLMGDYPLWLEIAKDWSVKYLSDYTVHYRVLKESASHSSNIEKVVFFNNSVMAIQKYYAQLTGKVDILTHIEERANIEIYVNCIEYNYDAIAPYRKKMANCLVITKKGQLFKFSARNRWMELMLRFFLKNETIRNLYSYLSKWIQR